MVAAQPLGCWTVGVGIVVSCCTRRLFVNQKKRNMPEARDVLRLEAPSIVVSWCGPYLSWVMSLRGNSWWRLVFARDEQSLVGVSRTL
jgi:hypothetical protein